MKKIFLLFLASFAILSCSRNADEAITISKNIGIYYYKIVYDGKTYSINGNTDDKWWGNFVNDCIYEPGGYIKLALYDKASTSKDYVTGDVFGYISIKPTTLKLGDKIIGDVDLGQYKLIPQNFSETQPSAKDLAISGSPQWANNSITFKISDAGSTFKYTLEGLIWGTPIKGSYDKTIYVFNGNYDKPGYNAKRLTIEFSALRTQW